MLLKNIFQHREFWGRHNLFSTHQFRLSFHEDKFQRDPSDTPPSKESRYFAIYPLFLSILLYIIVNMKFNIEFNMANLSLSLPDLLAKASQEAARRLGISRTQFIRDAIAHELENLQAEMEIEAMVSSIKAMKNSKEYLEESESITEHLNAELPEEKDWWAQK